MALSSLLWIGAHGDLRHVHVAVGHGHQAQILLAGALAGGGELRHGAGGREPWRTGRRCWNRPRCRGRATLHVLAAWPARDPVRRSRYRRPSRRRRESRADCPTNRSDMDNLRAERLAVRSRQSLQPLTRASSRAPVRGDGPFAGALAVDPCSASHSIA